MSNARQLGSRLVVGGVAAALLVERLRTLLSAAPTDFDDAYMFVRYADNLRAGFGMVWNRGGETVYGATGLVHLGLVTALRAIAPRWPDWRALLVATLAAAIAALLLATALATRFAAHAWLRGAPERALVAVVAAVAYSEAFVFHCGTGMDTMSALLANCGVVYASLALAARPTARAAAACALVGWLAVEARPDSVILAAGTPLLTLALLCAAPRRALTAWFAGPFAALVGASLLAKQHLLGSPLPLAFYVKRPFAYGGFAGEYTWTPFWFMAVFFRASAPLVVVIVVGARRRHVRTLAVLLLPVAVTFVALFAINQIMGHLGRFYFPSLPAFIGAAAVVSDGVWPLRWRALVVRAAIAAALALGGGAALDAAGTRYQARAEHQPLAALGGFTVAAAQPLPELDSWRAALEMAQLAAAAPAGARLAMSEHGVVAARAPDAVIIDVLGLHDRWFARHRFSAGELFRRRPDLIWMPHPDYTQMIRDILDDDELWRDYDFYPDALTFGVAVRRDGANAAALRRLFAARFGADYPGLRLDDYRAVRDPR
ncbi:MAG TPA: hypothetical protein VF997_19655 [Polyangia bacterium]